MGASFCPDQCIRFPYSPKWRGRMRTFRLVPRFFISEYVIRETIQFVIIRPLNADALHPSHAPSAAHRGHGCIHLIMISSLIKEGQFPAHLLNFCFSFPESLVPSHYFKWEELDINSVSRFEWNRPAAHFLAEAFRIKFESSASFGEWIMARLSYR